MKTTNQPNDPDDNAEFNEYVFFENGKLVTVRRPNPNFKPSADRQLDDALDEDAQREHISPSVEQHDLPF